MKMQAAVLNAAEDRLDVEQVKIAASRLCHTDWETMRGYQPFNLPAIIGHEGAGIVDRVDPGVSHFKEGDHVTYS